METVLLASQYALLEIIIATRCFNVCICISKWETFVLFLWWFKVVPLWKRTRTNTFHSRKQHHNPAITATVFLDSYEPIVKPSQSRLGWKSVKQYPQFLGNPKSSISVKLELLRISVIFQWIFTMHPNLEQHLLFPKLKVQDLWFLLYYYF